MGIQAIKPQGAVAKYLDYTLVVDLSHRETCEWIEKWIVLRRAYIGLVGLQSRQKINKSAENDLFVYLMAPHSYCKLLWEMQLESLSKRRKDINKDKNKSLQYYGETIIFI